MYSISNVLQRPYIKAEEQITTGKSLDPVGINISCGFPTDGFIVNDSWMLVKNYRWEHLVGAPDAMMLFLSTGV